MFFKVGNKKYSSDCANHLTLGQMIRRANKKRIVDSFLISFLVILVTNVSCVKAKDNVPSKYRIIDEQNFELPSDDPAIIKFEGAISTETVAAFMLLHNDTKAKVVLLNSQGGDAEAAMELGHWILDRKLDVYPVICFSACANYLFLSGQKKLLNNFSRVLWHGGMHQKDENEKYELNRRLIASMSREKLDKMSSSDRLALYRESELRRAYVRIRDIEDRFMARIRVKEYLFRLGQEPVWYEPDCWTASIPVMKSLGVRNIVGPSDFGNLKYLDSTPLAGFLCKGQPQSFALNKTGKIVSLRAKKISGNSRNLKGEINP
jgi:hypothetical protein